MPPPDTLLPRLHRDLGVQDRRRRPVAVFAVAASVVAVVGFAGLAVTQNMRVNDTRSRMDDIRSAMDFATRPGASMVQVDSSDSGTDPITEISAPRGRSASSWSGNDVPMPPEGTVYRVWLVSGTQATFATDFVPEPGMMVVELEFDPSLYDRHPDLGRAGGIDAGHAGDRGLADGELSCSRRRPRGCQGPWRSRPPVRTPARTPAGTPRTSRRCRRAARRRTAPGRPAPRTRSRTRR